MPDTKTYTVLIRLRYFTDASPDEKKEYAFWQKTLGTALGADRVVTRGDIDLEEEK